LRMEDRKWRCGVGSYELNNGPALDCESLKNCSLS
jgi:hypothetical protein